MWDPDDFEVYDGPPTKEHPAAVIFGAVALLVAVLSKLLIQ